MIRKIWAVKGSKPIILTTGSKRRKVVFGAVAENGTQLFRTYDACNSDSFLDFMKHVLGKYEKIALFIDKASWHKKEKRVKKYFRENRHRIKIRWFPSGFPEANPAEECWRQGKSDVLGSRFYKSFEEFEKAISCYYRTRSFNLDLYKYLCQ